MPLTAPARVVAPAWCVRTGRHAGVAPRRNAFAGYRPRTRLRQTGLFRRVRAAADGDGSGVGGGDGEARGESEYSQAEWDAALRMCAELLQEATIQANEETRKELLAAYKTEAIDSLNNGGEGGGDGEQKAPKPLALTLLELQTFWAGVGLKDFQAESLSMRLVQMQSAYVDVELLAQKFDRLKRCIPVAKELVRGAGGVVADVDVAQMLRNDLDVLHCDIRLLVMRLLELFQLFGHSNSVTELVTYCPKVLYCDDFEGKVAATADGIAFLYPKLTEEWVMAAIGEEPEMLFSLPKHQVRANRMDVAELPIELQNLIVWSTRQKHALQ